MRFGVLIACVTAACSLPQYTGPDMTHEAPDASGSAGSGSGSDTGPDEDGDGVPDALDTCPHLRDAPQLDSDGDGIGDACDPRPNDSVVKDRKVFVNFVDPSPPSLVIEGATQQNEASSLDLGETADESDSAIWTQDSFATAKIVVGFDVLDVGNNSFERVGVHVNRQGSVPGTMKSDACFIRKLDESTNYIYVEEIPVSPVVDHVVPQPLAHLSVTMSFAVDMTSLGCGAVANGQTSPIVTLVPSYHVGQVGVSTQSMVVRLRYLFVAGRS